MHETQPPTYLILPKPTSHLPDDESGYVVDDIRLYIRELGISIHRRQTLHICRVDDGRRALRPNWPKYRAARSVFNTVRVLRCRHLLFHQQLPQGRW